MRSHYSKDEMLLAVAKKKPRLQALIDGVQEMSQSDIEQLNESLWIREALLILKKSNGKGQKQRLQDLLDRTIEAERAATDIPKPTFEVRIWDIGDDFIGESNLRNAGQKYQIEIKKGDALLILDDDRIKVQDTLIYSGEFERTKIMYGSTFVAYMNLENYSGFVQCLLNQKHKNL